jgi:peptide chain release factor 3
VRFDDIPAFEPEHFAAVRSLEAAAHKSFGKGIAQLREEGAIQVFFPYGSMRTEPILGAVGELQFDVAQYRLQAEYNVKTSFTRLPYTLARRVLGEHEEVARATWPSNARLVEDWAGHPVALFESEWSLRLAQEWNAALTFAAFGEMNTVEVPR